MYKPACMGCSGSKEGNAFDQGVLELQKKLITILVVDDVPIIHMTLDKLLKGVCGADVEMRHANSVEEAVALLQDEMHTCPGWVLVVDYILRSPSNLDATGLDVVRYIETLPEQQQNQALCIGMTSPIDRKTMDIMEDAFHMVLWKPIQRAWVSSLTAVVEKCKEALHRGVPLHSVILK